MKKGNGGFQVGLFRHRKTLNARNPVDWTVSWLNLGNVVQGLVLPPPLCLPTCQLWMTLRNLSSYRRPCSTINLSQSCIRVRSQCHILKKAYSGRCVVNIHSFLFFFIWFQKIVWWRDSSNNNTKRKKTNSPNKMLRHMKMISTRPVPEIPIGIKTAKIADCSCDNNFGGGQAAGSRMEPYFKQPELPNDCKFLEPLIKGYERDWKWVPIFIIIFSIYLFIFFW